MLKQSPPQWNMAVPAIFVITTDCQHTITLSEYHFGKAETIGDADADIAIATYGLLVSEAVKAQELLQGFDVNACVFNMRTIAPLDEPLLLRWASSNKLLVVLEDHFQTGGLFSAIASTGARPCASESIPHKLEKQLVQPRSTRRCVAGHGPVRGANHGNDSCAVGA